jgi:NO-binding membrane sensor protein with MHYT domain
MSCLGAFLGLRCTGRARSFQGAARARWLLLGGISIGATGIWTMHFIAMLGFTIPGQTIHYNVPVTLLSLLVAVGIVCLGLLIVGFGDVTLGSLLLGGLITGLGVAMMHYLGMAAMRMNGRVTYDPGIFIISVVIAIVAATAALWMAMRLEGVGTTLAAAVIMGVAVSGMHYSGMAAMRMFPANGSAGMVMGGTSGATAESFLLPLIIGIAVVSFIMTATITLSPTADEIRYDRALMQHIEGLRSQGAAASLSAPASSAPRIKDARGADARVGLQGAPVDPGMHGAGGQNVPGSYGPPGNYGGQNGPGSYGGPGSYSAPDGPGSHGGQNGPGNYGTQNGPGTYGGSGSYGAQNGPGNYAGPGAPGAPGSTGNNGGQRGPGAPDMRGPAGPRR